MRYLEIDGIKKHVREQTQIPNLLTLALDGSVIENSTERMADFTFCRL
jgi:hypothetical protein